MEARRDLSRKLTGRLNSHRKTPESEAPTKLKPPSWWGTDEEESDATLRALGLT